MFYLFVIVYVSSDVCLFTNINDNFVIQIQNGTFVSNDTLHIYIFQNQENTINAFTCLYTNTNDKLYTVAVKYNMQ